MTARYMYSTQHNSKAKHNFGSCSLACINPAQFAPYNRAWYGKSLCVVGISLACACSAVCVGLNSAAFADEPVGQSSATSLDQQQTPKRTLTKEVVATMAGCEAKIEGDKLVIAPQGNTADGVISKDQKKDNFKALRSVITNADAQGKTLEFRGNIYGYGNISELFRESKISSLGNINRFDVSNVTNAQLLFYKCSNLTCTLDALSSWNTSHLKSLRGMFAECSSISGTFKGLNTWNTSNVKDMSYLFLDCEKLAGSLEPLASWNTSNVKNMRMLFCNCKNITGSFAPLASWDTSNVTNMKRMFYHCESISGSLTPLNSWNTSNVKDMGGMFYYCEALSGVNDLNNWDISNVVNAEHPGGYLDDFSLKYMFGGYDVEGVGNGKDFVLNFSNKSFDNNVSTNKMFKCLRGTLVATNWHNFKLPHNDNFYWAKNGQILGDDPEIKFTFVTDDTTGLTDIDYVTEKGHYAIKPYNVTVTYKTPDGKTCTKTVALKYARALKKPGTNNQEEKPPTFDLAEQEAYRTAAQAIVQYDIDGLKKQHPNWIITDKFHVGAQLPATLPRNIEEVKDITIDLGQITVNQEHKPNLEPELTALYRLYNPYTHEHFFTAETGENDNLVRLGWKSEGGVGYVYKHAEKGGVYRLYNPTTGEHHYTMNEDEVAKCVKAGWKNEGVKWFSAQDKEVTLNKLYSMYNPYEKKFYHHYTADAQEIEQMVKAGWRKEEVKWCTLPQCATR